MRAGLAEADAHPDPLVQFERWFSDALAAALPLANADDARHRHRRGRARCTRVVLLKGVESGGFVFYTNYDSRKGRAARGMRPRPASSSCGRSASGRCGIEGKVEKVSAADSTSISRAGLLAPACRLAPRRKASVVDE